MKLLKLREDLTNRQLIDTLDVVNVEYMKLRERITEEVLPLCQKLLAVKQEILNVLENRSHDQKENSK